MVSRQAKGTLALYFTLIHVLMTDNSPPCWENQCSCLSNILYLDLGAFAVAVGLLFWSARCQVALTAAFTPWLARSIE